MSRFISCTVIFELKQDGNDPFFRQKSASNWNLRESQLPSFLVSELLVKRSTKGQEILEQRRNLAQSKSVQELSQMRSISDFPIPGTIERIVSQRNIDVPTERR